VYLIHLADDEAAGLRRRLRTLWARQAEALRANCVGHGNSRRAPSG